MLFLASNMDNIGAVDSTLVAILGYCVVFLGLILLMAVVVLMGKAFTGKASKKAAPAPAPVVESAPVVEAPTAPGSAGKLKLHDVEPKTAAMIMAIVADKLGKPINELRFISIREVK